MDKLNEEAINPNINQQISDKTYTDIYLFIRDTSLSMSYFLDDEIGSIYQVEDNVYVRNSFDGLRKGTRLYIFSNHLDNSSSKTDPAHSTVFTIFKGERIKMIGRSTFHDKSAIYFLHLPSDGWEEFFKDSSLIDSQLVNYATREFEVECEQKENPKTRDWLYNEKNKVSIKKEDKPKLEIYDNKNEGLV